MTFNVGDKVYTKDLPNKTLVISEIYINEGNPFDGYKFANFEGKDFTELVHNLEHVVKAPVPEAPAIRTEYLSYCSANQDEFESGCSEKLNEGYTPIGGISVNYNSGDDYYLYSQAFAISREIENTYSPTEVK